LQELLTEPSDGARPDSPELAAVLAAAAVPRDIPPVCALPSRSTPAPGLGTALCRVE